MQREGVHDGVKCSLEPLLVVGLFCDQQHEAAATGASKCIPRKPRRHRRQRASDQRRLNPIASHELFLRPIVGDALPKCVDISLQDSRLDCFSVRDEIGDGVNNLWQPRKPAPQHTLMGGQHTSRE